MDVLRRDTVQGGPGPAPVWTRLLCYPGTTGPWSGKPKTILPAGLPEPGSEHRHSEMPINQGNHRGPAAWWGWICFQVGGEENSMVGNCFQDREEFCFSFSERPGREESTGKDGRGMAISMHVPHLSPKRWQLLGVSCVFCAPLEGGSGDRGEIQGFQARSSTLPHAGIT